jgi:hypothetical protein
MPADANESDLILGARQRASGSKRLPRVSPAKWPVGVALDELGHALVVVDWPARNGVGERESLSMREASMGSRR